MKMKARCFPGLALVVGSVLACSEAPPMEPGEPPPGVRLDTGFGEGGQLSTSAQDPSLVGNSLCAFARADTGDLLAVVASETEYTLARLTPEGVLRATVALPAGTHSQETLRQGRLRCGLGLGADGAVFLAGTAGAADGTGRGFFVARFFVGGEGEPLLRHDGTTQLPVTSSQPESFEVVDFARLQDGASLLLGGDAGGLGLARLTAAGQPDPSFGQGGVLRFGEPSFPRLLVLPDGSSRVVTTVARGAAGAEQATAVVHGFLPDGSRAPGFGTQGEAAIALGRAPGEVVAAPAVLLPDGGMLLALSGGPTRLLRLTRSGGADPSYGEGGIAPAWPSSGEAPTVRNLPVLARLPEGELLVATWRAALDGSGDQVVLARLSETGVLEAEAEAAPLSGIVTMTTVSYRDAAQILVLPDQRVLVASGDGFLNHPTGQLGVRPHLARFLLAEAP